MHSRSRRVVVVVGLTSKHALRIAEKVFPHANLPLAGSRRRSSAKPTTKRERKPAAKTGRRQTTPESANECATLSSRSDFNFEPPFRKLPAPAKAELSARPLLMLLAALGQFGEHYSAGPVGCRQPDWLETSSFYFFIIIITITIMAISAPAPATTRPLPSAGCRRCCCCSGSSAAIGSRQSLQVHLLPRLLLHLRRQRLRPASELES